MKYVCELCGCIYDEAQGNTRAGIRPGTRFADLPEDYECPCCGCQKEALNPVQPRMEATAKLRVFGRAAV